MRRGAICVCLLDYVLCVCEVAAAAVSVGLKPAAGL